ncbi:molting protein mlt-4 [Anaeramoeba flamelloides]|uniref:Molting protein mlt-4 n=1 Tax=Anaeramoeba flamelloides TaxID=1746091 RepID=A0ABQ8Y310_9EUKA|nr:molting protein mlt-4 [Anaeramoeba flamelloides]
MSKKEQINNKKKTIRINVPPKRNQTTTNTLSVSNKNRLAKSAQDGENKFTQFLLNINHQTSPKQTISKSYNEKKSGFKDAIVFNLSPTKKKQQKQFKKPVQKKNKFTKHQKEMNSLDIQEFQNSIQEKDLMGLKKILTKKPNLVNELIEKFSPLSYCIQQNFIEGFIFILPKVKNIDQTDDYSYTALHEACESGKLEIVKLLYKYGSNLNCRTEEGKTALYLAYNQGYLDIVEYLIKKFAKQSSKIEEQLLGLTLEPNKKENNEQIFNYNNEAYLEERESYESFKKLGLWNEFHLSIMNGKLNEFLTKNFRELENSKNNSLNSDNKNDDVGKEDKKNKVDQEDKEDRERKEIDFKKLINKRSLFEGLSPLHLAIGKPEIMEQLIRLGAEIDPIDNWLETPLHKSIRMKSWESAMILISHGANYKKKSSEGSVLHLSIYNKDYQSLLFFLEKGININTQDTSLNTILHIACSNGLLDIIEILLKKKNISLNCQTEKGLTPLHKACMLNSDELFEKDLEKIEQFKKRKLMIVKLLINKGANYELTDSKGRTPLLCSCIFDMADIFKYLKSIGAQIFKGDSEGATGLHWAISRNNNQIIEEYLSCQKIDLNITDYKGYTPLHEACHAGNLGVILTLLKMGANIDVVTQEGMGVCHWSIHSNETEVLSLLIENGADLDKKDFKGKTPLAYAIEQDRNKLAKWLIKYGADIQTTTFSGLNLLSLCSINGNEKILNLLLQNEQIKLLNLINKMDHSQKSPLIYACENKHINILNILIRHGADINQLGTNGQSILHFASACSSDRCLKALLNLDTKIDLRDNSGHTALHCSCAAGSLKCIKLLIEAGCKVNVKDYFGSTPLHEAACINNSKIFDYLVNVGKADILVKDLNGSTPVHVAAISGSTQIMEWLIENNMPLTNIDEDGNIPLHLAVEADCIEIVELILSQKNAKEIINFENFALKTPLHLAIEMENAPITECLLINGADASVLEELGRRVSDFEFII